MKVTETTITDEVGTKRIQLKVSREEWKANSAKYFNALSPEETKNSTNGLGVWKGSKAPYLGKYFRIDSFENNEYILTQVFPITVKASQFF